MSFQGAQRARAWLLGFVALLLVTIGLALRFRSTDPVLAADALLSQAATEPRAHPWRIPRTPWTPERLTRQSANTAKSAKLLRAEALIAENLGSGDARWKALAARSALLDNKPGSAIQILDSPSRKRTREEFSTLAAAHAIRATLENRPSELGAAVEFAVRTLDLDASDLTARFTLANAYENLSMVSESLAEWNRYLEIEREDAWRNEAIRHVDGLRKIQQQRASALAQANPADAVLDAPSLQLLADRARAAEAGSRVAAKDPWLATAAREAVDSAPLLEAAKSNLTERFDAALALASKAPYGAAPAHAARLQLEAVFAHNRLRNTAECIALADRLQSQPYTWIRVQALSHSSGCLRMQGNTAGALERQRAAIELARSHGLEALALRSSVVLVFQLTDSGDLWRAWLENRSILGRLQTSPYSVNRIHQCLVNYSSGAERRGWPAAAAVFMRAAADTLAGTEYKTTQAANRATAAALATRAGLSSIAVEQTALAARIANELPDAVRIIAAEAWLALGKASDALGALSGLSGKLSPVERRRASRVQGIANALLGNDAEALRHLDPMSRALDAEMSGMQRAEASAMRRDHEAAFRTQAQLLVRAGESSRALNLWVRANGGDVETGLPDLVWLRMDDGYAVWTQGQLRRVRLSHASFDSLVQRIVAQASDPDTKPSSTDIDRVRQVLFEGADGCVAANRELTVLADGAIAALPFSLLTDRCPMILAASPAEKVELQGRALIVHNPETPEGLPYLSDAAAEAESARAAVVSSEAPLTGRDATQSIVLEKLRDARLFHFAGHGYSLPGAGGLYLADGLLSADSIRTLDLRACSLVVLSACSTGSGEHSHSLVRSFLDAGARNIIATRWNVDSPATSALMRNFYRRLATAPSPAVALHLAIQDLRSLPKYSHPYFWAAFQLHQ